MRVLGRRMVRRKRRLSLLLRNKFSVSRTPPSTPYFKQGTESATDTVKFMPLSQYAPSFLFFHDQAYLEWKAQQIVLANILIFPRIFSQHLDLQPFVHFQHHKDID